MWAKILTKIVAGVSGPIAWVASIFIDKLLKIATDAAKEGYRLIMQAIEDQKRRGQNAQIDTKYKDTLKDGVKNEDQVNASTDILNSNRDK